MNGRRTVARACLVAFILLTGLAAGGCAPVGTAGGPSRGPTACSMSEAADGDVRATIVDFAFEPATISVVGDQSVTFRNTGAEEHTVALDDGACASGVIAPGKSVTYVIGPVGRHGFHCTIHPTMTGTIEVTAS